MDQVHKENTDIEIEVKHIRVEYTKKIQTLK